MSEDTPDRKQTIYGIVAAVVLVVLIALIRIFHLY
jgi:hypothetical protein